MGLRFAGRSRRPSPVRRGPQDDRRPQDERDEPPRQPPRAPTAPPAEERRPAGPQIGLFTSDGIITVFTWFLYGAALLLAVLSIGGTFYGLLGANAPVGTFEALRSVPIDVKAHTNIAIVALVVQGILSLLQYGSRQMARNVPQWWFLYLAALGISLYYNWQAYYAPLSTMLGAWVAAPVIILGDIMPELISTRREPRKKG